VKTPLCCLVRIFLKHVPSGQFLDGDGQRTSDIGQAITFQNTIASFDFSKAHKCGHTFTVLRFRDVGPDLELDNGA